MLSRLVIASVALAVVSRTSAVAQNHDYLQHGEEQATAEYEIKYRHAVRYVLARGLRKDVVVRMVNIPPFQPESVTGVARTPSGYTAFEVTASKHIWSELGFGSSDPNRKKGNYRGIKPVLQERAMSDTLAGRVAALWRRAHRLAQLR